MSLQGWSTTRGGSNPRYRWSATGRGHIAGPGYQHSATVAGPGANHSRSNTGAPAPRLTHRV